MFDSIYSSTATAGQFFAMAAAALVTGVLYAWLMSFKVCSSRRFFLVLSLLPFIVAAVITFVKGSIGAGVAIGGAFGLIRFRSAQGSSEELAAIRVPTLVVAGTRDMIRQKHTRLIAASIPSAQLVILDGDHFVANKRPKAFNEAVLDFLRCGSDL